MAPSSDLSVRASWEAARGALGSSAPAAVPGRALHLPPHRWPLRAVVRVNSVPQCGHTALAAEPLFSRWWRRRLLKVLNCRPLQPWSKHCGLGRDVRTRNPDVDGSAGADSSAGYTPGAGTAGAGWEGMVGGR